MATYLLPDAFARRATHCGMRLTGSVFANSSPMNGYVTTVEIPGDQWIIRAEFAGMHYPEYRAHEGFWNRFRGQAHRLRVGHLMNRLPLGTARGTIQAFAAAEGSSEITLNQSISGGTLRSGDMLEIAILGGRTQLVQLAEDGVTEGTTIYVKLTAPIRRGISVGAAVIWNQPKADFLLTQSPELIYQGNIGLGYAFEAAEMPL